MQTDCSRLLGPGNWRGFVCGGMNGGMAPLLAGDYSKLNWFQVLYLYALMWAEDYGVYVAVVAGAAVPDSHAWYTSCNVKQAK